MLSNSYGCVVMSCKKCLCKYDMQVAVSNNFFSRLSLITGGDSKHLISSLFSGASFNKMMVYINFTLR